MKRLLLLFLSVAYAPSLFAQPSFPAGAVLNAVGYQPELAPNTVFVIFGSNMGPAELVSAAGPDYPEELAGTSVSFTPLAKGAEVIQARMVYTLSGQVAGLLLSTATPGDYAVRVTYNGQTSPPQTVTVVARSFGIATANSRGFGMAQATIGNVNGGVSLTRFTSGNLPAGAFNYVLGPPQPGHTVVVWGSGGGADLANDTGGSSGDQTQAGNFRVLLGDRVIVPDYAGTSFGSPGLWQVNFTISLDFPPDCFNRLQIEANGVLSNHVILPIAPPGMDYCVSAAYDEAALAKLDNGGQLLGASLVLTEVDAMITTVNPPMTSTATARTITALFNRYDAEALIEQASGLQIGTCTIFRKRAFHPVIGIGIPSGAVDAGTLTVSGPGLPPNTMLTRDAMFNYFYGPPTIQGGRYTIAGTGGAVIGAFEAAVDVPEDFDVPAFATFNNLDRSMPFTFDWTGGAADSMVTINILTTRTISGSQADLETWLIERTTVYCEAPVGDGTFTVSPEVLSYLTPASLDPATGTDAHMAIAAIKESDAARFRPPLTAGGMTDFGGFIYSIGRTRNLTVE